VPETPTVIGSISAVGYSPEGAAYDPQDGDLYVTNAGSDNVTVLSGGVPIASPSVGGTPESAMFDPADGMVWVANRGGNSITLLNGTTVNGTISGSIFFGPFAMAYNPVNNLVYVTDLDVKSPGYVTLLNATSLAYMGLVATGSYPAGVAYDPQNGYMYVANAASAANGGASVTVISNRTVIATITGGMATPLAVLYDPANGRIYVSDQNLVDPIVGWVTVISGTKEVGTIGVGGGPFGEAYDPESGYILTTNSGTNNVSVITGSGSVVATLDVGNTPYEPVYDPGNGLIFVTNGNSDNVSVIASGLEVTAITTTPAGNPADSMDLGGAVSFNATVAQPGAGKDEPSVSVSPSSGLGCGSLTIQREVLKALGLGVTCRPTAPGIYTVWMNVTDADALSAWSWVEFQVFPTLVAQTPSATTPAQQSITSADTGEVVVFHAHATGGTDNLTQFVWVGLPSSGCSGLGTSTPTCTPTATGGLNVTVALTDSNGAISLSGVLTFPVYAHPSAERPTASRTIADVGQAVTFTEVAVVGPGVFAYTWSGLGTASCSGLTSATPDCTFPSPGNYSVGVQIEDTNGYFDTSPNTVVSVFAPPSTSAPTSDVASADVGQTVRFTTTISGGYGAITYAWTGLPTGICQGNLTATPSCVIEGAGTFTIQVAATDADGATSLPSTSTSFVTYPAPTVTNPTVTPDPVILGGSVRISVSTRGGAPGMTFDWSGLPPGCGGATGVVSCAPTALGSYWVSVNVTDGNGATAASGEADLNVTAAVPPSSGGSGSLVLYGAVGGGIAIALAVALYGGWRMGRRRPPVSPPRT
jgi:DNA-binding beta-propeller fold protein YncE